MLHNLLGPARPGAPVAHASNFHVSDDDGGTAQARPVPSDETPPAEVAGIQMGKPVVALFLILAILFMLRVIKDAGNEVLKRDHTHFREVDVTLWNILIVSTLAIPGIAMHKFFANKYLGTGNPWRQLTNGV